MRARSRQRTTTLTHVHAKAPHIPVPRPVGQGHVPKTGRRRRAARMQLLLYSIPTTRAMRSGKQSPLIRGSRSKAHPRNRRSLRNRISLPQRSAEGRRNCPLLHRKASVQRGRNRVRHMPQGLLPQLQRASLLPSAVRPGAASAASARGLRTTSAPAVGSPSSHL